MFAHRPVLKGWRVRAREKLPRLSNNQFQELSTDVYDECIRRKVVRKSMPEGLDAMSESRFEILRSILTLAPIPFLPPIAQFPSQT